MTVDVGDYIESMQHRPGVHPLLSEQRLGFCDSPTGLVREACVLCRLSLARVEACAAFPILEDLVSSTANRTFVFYLVLATTARCIAGTL